MQKGFDKNKDARIDESEYIEWAANKKAKAKIKK